MQQPLKKYLQGMSLPGVTFSELINKPDRTVERLTGAHAAALRRSASRLTCVEVAQHRLDLGYLGELPVRHGQHEDFGSVDVDIRDRKPVQG